MTNTTNTTAAKHYAKRDPEAQGNDYINHVYAMTTEGLHATRRTSQLAHRDIEIERLRAALASPAQAVPASVIMASVMRDDGGEHPAFCLMVAYRAEKDAMTALAMLTDEPAQQAAPAPASHPVVMPEPHYGKGRYLGFARYNDAYSVAQVQAMLSSAPNETSEYPPLVCDYCGALTPDPWHSSGMMNGKMSKHIHSCDACAAQGAAQVQAMLAAVPRNATLYDPDDVAFPVQRSAEGVDVPTELASIAAAKKGGQHGAE